MPSPPADSARSQLRAGQGTYLQLKRTLHLRRKALKLSLRKAAAEIGVHYNTLWAWENGHGEPDGPYLFRWATFLGITINFASQEFVTPTISQAARHAYRVHRLPQLAGAIVARQAVRDAVPTFSTHNDNSPTQAARFRLFRLKRAC